MVVVRIVVTVFGAFVRERSELAAENLALRQQLALFERRSKCPRLRKRDRVFWAILSRIWPKWRSALLIVQPETVVRWHRQGFKLSWRAIRPMKGTCVLRPECPAQTISLKDSTRTAVAMMQPDYMPNRYDGGRLRMIEFVRFV